MLEAIDEIAEDVKRESNGLDCPDRSAVARELVRDGLQARARRKR